MRYFLIFALVIGFYWTRAAVADEVELKDGDVFQGTIVEEKLNQHVKVRLPNGKEKKIKWAQIKEIKRGGGSSGSSGEGLFAEYAEMDSTSRHEAVLSMANGNVMFNANGHYLWLRAQYYYMPIHHIQVGAYIDWTHVRANNANLNAPLMLQGSAEINFPFDVPLKDAFFGGTNLGLWDAGKTEFAFGFFVGKRFLVLDRLSYRPTAGILKVGGMDLFFYVHPIAVSLIL